MTEDGYLEEQLGLHVTVTSDKHTGTMPALLPLYLVCNHHACLVALHVSAPEMLRHTFGHPQTEQALPATNGHMNATRQI